MVKDTLFNSPENIGTSVRMTNRQGEVLSFRSSRFEDIDEFSFDLIHVDKEYNEIGSAFNDLSRESLEAVYAHIGKVLEGSE